MADERRLPLKVVIASTSDYRPMGGGGGDRKVFGDVTDDLREALALQLESVHKTFADTFNAWPGVPAVAKVVLKDEALAKSHRPKELLRETTCPVIGVDRLGELLVSASPAGLDRLAQKVRTESTKGGIASISAIDRIEPYAPSAAQPSCLDALTEVVKAGEPLKLRLFRHPSTAGNEALRAALAQHLRQLGIESAKELHYAASLALFSLNGVEAAGVAPLARFVGTQALSAFPLYRRVRSASRPVATTTPADFPPPEAGREYPVVGLVDSGIDPSSVYLAPWIVARESYVPDPSNRDYEHGSFVGGLIVHGRRLNQSDLRFPDCSAKIVDVIALPADGTISEQDLVAILQEVVPKHPNVVCWNLSLAGSSPCVDGSYSDLAVALDELQDSYGAQFVLAAGNYEGPPMRRWPPDAVTLGEADRICSPADSVRAITVGSLAHLARPNSCVNAEEVSPFSRRGPGPFFLPKPELIHYGGNCDGSHGYAQTGVMSVGLGGQIAENIGTSFAAPLVAASMATVMHEVDNGSSTLAKALLVHAAALNEKAIVAENLRYRGFGVPPGVIDVLTCESTSATLIFEMELVPGVEYEKVGFPIPPCMRGSDGLVRGEITMTLAYEPPLDATGGAEYCRSNVDASLGTYDLNKAGKREHRGQVPPQPQDVSQWFEKKLVEHGFKWSPIKVYRRRMPRGVNGTLWRLALSTVYRLGEVPPQPQRAVLVVTLRDASSKGPVYDEVVQLMNQSGWNALDLELRNRTRYRVA